jgi:hypothetical protein
LISGFQSVPKEAPATKPARPEQPFIAASPTDWWNAAQSTLSAFRNSVQYNAQTFQPDTNALIAELSNDFALDKTFKLRSSIISIVDQTAQNEIDVELKAIYHARAAVSDYGQSTQLFKDLDGNFTGLRTSLQTANNNGVTPMMSVIQGRALLDQLTNQIENCNSYLVLTATISAAGGSTQTKHIFLLELFYPGLSPFNNGGAIVSYVVTTAKGDFVAGRILRYMHDWSKWKPKKVPRYSNLCPQSVGAEGPCSVSH